MSERKVQAEHSEQTFEQLNQKHEHPLKHETSTKPIKANEKLNSSHELSKQIESLRKSAEQQASPRAAEVNRLRSAERNEPDSPALINAELKDIAYQRTLRRIQKELPVAVRTFSKIIHHPLIETISDAGSKTIGRPSGVLAGGICAFLGSSLLLYITKYYGYNYNFLMFAIFFISGFVAGLLIEAAYRIAKRAKH